MEQQQQEGVEKLLMRVEQLLAVDSEELRGKAAVAVAKLGAEEKNTYQHMSDALLRAALKQLAQQPPAAAAELATLPRVLHYVPVILVMAITLVMGLWQLQRQGWRVQRENVPWHLAGVWGVVSAVKDALRFEVPYKFVVTVPMWVAGRVRAFRRREGGAALVGWLEVMPWVMICVFIAIADAVAIMVYSVPAQHP